MPRHAGGRPRLPLDEDHVLELYNQPGATLTSVANQLGIDRSRVRRVAQDHGVLRDDRGTHDAVLLNLPLKGSQVPPPRSERDWVTSSELVIDADITYRQCDYWTRTDLLHPMDDHTPGSGHQRRYPVAQIERAQALAALLDAGVSLPTCRLVIDQVLATGTADLGPVRFTYQPKEAS